jgi:hypothetical protein
MLSKTAFRISGTVVFHLLRFFHYRQKAAGFREKSAGGCVSGKIKNA